MAEKQKANLEDVATVLISDFGMTKTDAKAAVTAVFSYIQEKVDAGYNVKIKNFGTVYQKHYRVPSGRMNKMISLRPSKKNKKY